MPIDPTKIAKLAQQIAANKSTGDNTKDAVVNVAKETIKAKLGVLFTVKVLPIILALLLIGLLVWFVASSISKAASFASTGGGTSCLTQEEISIKQQEIAEMEEGEAKKKAQDDLNDLIAKVGICIDSSGGGSPEGVIGGVFYDQEALHLIILEIKAYLNNEGPGPDLESIIQRVLATIDATDANISQVEKDKKKKAVAKKIRNLYANEVSSKEKWNAIWRYLRNERGLFLWKAAIGNPIVAAVRTRIGMPYILGNRMNWTGECYDNTKNDNASWYKHTKGCGFDCSSLAGYGAAVGHKQSTGIWVTSNGDKYIEACKQFRSVICPYNTTVSEIARYASNGTFTYLPSASELAPGDYVIILKNNEYQHVVIYAGKVDGKDSYVESPQGGPYICPQYCVRERGSWWGTSAWGKQYVRPYQTIMFKD